MNGYVTEILMARAAKSAERPAALRGATEDRLCDENVEIDVGADGKMSGLAVVACRRDINGITLTHKLPTSYPEVALCLTRLDQSLFESEGR